MRNEFPIFDAHPELIYLDSAATAQKPRSVINALTKFYSENYATVHRAIYRHAIKAGDAYNESREAAAKFLNVQLEEIVFTRGTTASLNLVAQSYGRIFINEGDEILVSEMEHHSNLVPWQILAKEKKAVLRYIPMNSSGELEWEGTINSKTKLVAVVHVSNVTGTINPIKEIVKAAHQHGAVVVVDGAQAAPHMNIDVKELDVDFYAFSGHKCYGPTGVGVLSGKRELLDQMPPVEGGGDMVEKVTYEEALYQKPPLLFEAGTPMIGSVIALKPALEFVKGHKNLDHLLSHGLERLKSIPNLKVLGDAKERGPLITFHIEGVHPLDIATLLDLKNIAIRSGHLCAQPLLNKFGLTAAVRASFGAYNIIEEVDKFVDEVALIVKKLSLSIR